MSNMGVNFLVRITIITLRYSSFSGSLGICLITILVLYNPHLSLTILNCYTLQIKSASQEVKKTKLVTLAWQGKQDAESAEVIKLPLPYKLPPVPYSPEGKTPSSFPFLFFFKNREFLLLLNTNSLLPTYDCPFALR